MSHPSSARSLPVLSFLALAAAATAQWQVQPTANVPTGRYQAAMCYELAGGRTLLFGGQPMSGTVQLGDTWAYDGADWTQLQPAASPSGRAGMEMVYDSLRQVVVLYGGTRPGVLPGPSLDETWEFDGTTWAQIATAHTPGGRRWFGMTFDSFRGRTVIYGGQPSSLLLGDSNQTWEYDGVDWTQVNAATNPGPLENPGMCFAEFLGRVVLFGGINVQGVFSTTTWLYDGANWTAAPVAGATPPVRALPRMVYDGQRGRCVLHGGMDPSGTPLFADTWEFDGAGWTQRSATAPAARKWHRLAYDAGRGLTVMSGGHDAAFAPVLDTLEFGPRAASFGSGCVGSNGPVTIAVSGPPRLGLPLQTTVQHLIPGAPFAIVLTGFSDTLWTGLPLPLDATPFGLPGCTLYVSPDLADLAPASGLLRNIPNDPFLFGATFYQQGFSFELPGWNAFGGTLSDAVRLRIGG